MIYVAKNKHFEDSALHLETNIGLGSDFKTKINIEKLVLSFDWILLLYKKKLNPGIAYFNSRICKLFQLLMYLTAKVFYS